MYTIIDYIYRKGGSMLRPTHDYVVLKIKDRTESGIVLSSYCNVAQVLAIGPEVHGALYTIGSRVYFNRDKAIECGEYILIQDAYILAEVEA